MGFDRIMELLGLGIGLLYLYWEYKADPKLWWASIAMPLVSFWVYYDSGLYADFAINIYYLVISVFGYINWTLRRHRAAHAGEAHISKPASGNKKGSPGSAEPELPITHIPLRAAFGCVAVFGLLFCATAWWLVRYTDSTVPYADAFTTALSILAMWMLARKYLEQWLAWIAVDAVSAVLYVYKGIPFYGVLYALYTVVAVLGYRKWRRLMSERLA